MKWILITAIVATAFAGCVGDGTMTARDGLGDAKDAAEEWMDDPQLIGIFSIEPFEELGDEDEGLEVRLHLDDNPGDGRSPGWAYGFSDGQDSVLIILGKGLGLIAEIFEAGDGDYEPLADWSIDSDEVIDILSEQEDWPGVDRSTLIFWVLDEMHGRPVWIIELEGDDVSYEAVVAADDGEVLASGEEQPMVGTGSFSTNGGTFVSVLGTQTVSGELGGVGTIHISVSVTTYVVAPTVTLTGPAGTVYSASYPAGGVNEVFTDLPPGTYQLVVDSTPVSIGVSMSMDGSW